MDYDRHILIKAGLGAVLFVSIVVAVSSGMFAFVLYFFFNTIGAQ
jgi:hypothetical protein